MLRAETLDTIIHISNYLAEHYKLKWTKFKCVEMLDANYGKHDTFYIAYELCEPANGDRKNEVHAFEITNKLCCRDELLVAYDIDGEHVMYERIKLKDILMKIEQ